MKRQVWINLMLAALVAGLFTTASCAKKQVVSEPAQVEDQTEQVTETGETEAERLARLEQERIEAQQLEEQREQERLAQIAAAKERFLNENILFDYDSAELGAEAKALLREKAEWLQENSSVAVMIEGHCDERGTTVYNLALGERRATAARNYLVDLGVAAGRLGTISYGEEKPLDLGHTETAFKINRRAQFVIN